MINLKTIALKVTLASSLILSTAACHHETVETKPLSEDEQVSLKRIFETSDFRGDWFGGANWLKDGRGYTLIQKSSEIDGGRDVVLYNAESGEQTILLSAKDLIPEGRDKPLDISGFAWSDDGKKALIYNNRKQVWRYHTQGDYWILDMETKRLAQVGQEFPASSLMFAKFSPDGSKVAYVQKTGAKIHDIYVEDVDTGRKTRLTKDGSETIINGTFDWVYEEEFGLRDGFRWSPDGKKIAYWQLDASGVRDFTMINNTDAKDNYPTLTTFSYPKVGETNSAAKLGVVSVAGGETTWMSIEGDKRNNYLAYMEWAGNSDELVVQQLNRRQNTINLLMVNADSGQPKTVLVEKDEAFLDPVTDFKWLNEGKEFLWVTEKNGFRQVLRVSRDGTTTQDISKPEYDVISIRRVDTVGGYLYFYASPDDVQRRSLYRLALDGQSPAEKLTPEERKGYHSYSISHDGKWAFHDYNNRNKANVKTLVSLPDHKVVRTYVDNNKLQETYDKLAKGKTELFSVTTKEGHVLPGFMRYPHDFDASKKYPVIFYVYGEPAGATSTDRWGRNMAWDIMMTQRGYIVATLDNRGTPLPKGRAWRKSIYRTLGLTNVNDQAAGVNAMLAERPYMDADRIGIWGHSGGGTSTLHALFRHGDTFKVGVSQAPVPDTRLYDTIYQERYSGILPEDAAFYEKSVAVNYAHLLKGKLLVVHGTGDDNVHYQGTERLINKLIEHNIQFDFMSYPNRAHGIYRGKNTRYHLTTLRTNYFLTHLPAGPLDR
ncbi:S9 family peptidase [Temperatibacter marinus]|uniref:S9 family peptidase n=1 Tax=Temperatibacter marinus TaxID=1456591 RepID=A0AA52EGR9_9PROT|nr:S9 family peptidase [Temperatibacter marinus]WND02853.1 S9 family peptidase [Temperatibacter marinus]